MPASRIPEYQPVVDAFEQYMRKTGTTKIELCGKIFGFKEGGRPKGTGALYPIINGSVGISDATRARIKEAIGIDLPKIVKSPKPRQALTPVKAAVQAFETAQKQQAAEPLPPSTWGRRAPSQGPSRSQSGLPPRFALSIGQDGRAHVTMNLIDVDSSEALQVFAVLNAAGLVKG